MSVGIVGGMRLDIISTRFLFKGLDDFPMPHGEHELHNIFGVGRCLRRGI